MNLFTYLLQILRFIFSLSWLSIPPFGFVTPTFIPPELPKIPEKTEEDIFISSTTTRFLATKLEDANVNVADCFYDVELFRKQTIQLDNELEKTWRRRQLMLNTPRGLVIMFYDAYKLGFSYYANDFIPYPVLNAIAMKYVIMYRCRDFFIDEHIIPDDEKSRLINLFEVDKPADIAAIAEKNGINIPTDAPFAKLKTYNKGTGLDQSNIPTKNVGDKRTTKSGMEIKRTNRFINLGKTRNFEVLNKPKPVNKLNGFDTALIPKKVLTYKEYKMQEMVADK